MARDFRCGGCRATLVFQDEAAAIVDELGRGEALCLEELVRGPGFAPTAIFHVGRSGPVRGRLRQAGDYQESEYRSDLAPGRPTRHRGPRCTNQDHQRLTFADDTFDLMVSSHVLEHVPDPTLALAEAYRVLRPRGRYIFTIPGRRLRARSTRRAEVVDGEVNHLLEPRYHNSPEGQPALVFTDFGRDLLDTLEELGFIATLRRPHRAVQEAQLSFVIVALKPGPAPAARSSAAAQPRRPPVAASRVRLDRWERRARRGARRIRSLPSRRPGGRGPEQAS